MKSFDFDATLDRFLTPQKVLSPLIFDDNEKMHEDIRQGLLKIADKIFELTIGKTNGLEPEDVCLIGSLSGYLYHEKSDIDMLIIIKNKNCKELAKDNRHFDIFTSAQKNALKKRNVSFSWRKKGIDVKILPHSPFYATLYSIKNDKWIIKPNKNDFENIKKEDIINAYLLKKQKILDELQTIHTKNTGFDLADQLHFFYLQTMEQFVTHKNQISDHIVYKLLSKEGIFSMLADLAIRAYNSNCTFQK